MWYNHLRRTAFEESTVWPKQLSDWDLAPTRGRRQLAVALMACLAMVFSLALGATIHRHHSAATPCHICQLGHMPMLATAAPELVSNPGPAVRYDLLPAHAALLEPCALHRAPRAPPAA